MRAGQLHEQRRLVGEMFGVAVHHCTRLSRCQRRANLAVWYHDQERQPSHVLTSSTAWKEH